MGLRRSGDDRGLAAVAETAFALVVVSALILSGLAADEPADDRRGRPTRTPGKSRQAPSSRGRGEPATSRAAVTEDARRAVTAPTGRLVAAPGTSRRVGTGAALQFKVEVEKGVGVRREAFAAAVERALFDERSWARGGDVALRRVDHGPVAFSVTLAHPSTVDERCLPLRTVGRYSCWDGRRAMLNLDRWLRGAPTYRGDLAGYRRYLVNHEVGHALGHGHLECPSPGRRAPVMMQQTMRLGGCRRNPWPHP